MKKVIIIIGTRPEAIKMIPLYLTLRNSGFNTKLCITAQHREMLDDVLDFFKVTADFDLNVMQKNQSLEALSSKVLQGVSQIFKQYTFDLVFVHGDTTTTLFASLAAYYNKIDVAHIEAGLRTYNMYAPYPEEINRQMTARIARYHFAPTQRAKENLINEHIEPKNIFVVGNTVIDTLFLTLEKLKIKPRKRKKILITAHRRENFGKGISNICTAIKLLAQKYKDFEFIYPVHPNPNIKQPVMQLLDGIDNVTLLPPQNYFDFVALMSQSYLILTDSGGIQEEAPSLGKPVLVLRATTERPEAVEAGTVKIVGTDVKKIVSEVSALIENKAFYETMAQAVNPYGDGKASQRIVEIVKSL